MPTASMGAKIGAVEDPGRGDNAGDAAERAHRGRDRFRHGRIVGDVDREGERVRRRQ